MCYSVNVPLKDSVTGEINYTRHAGIMCSLCFPIFEHLSRLEVLYSIACACFSLEKFWLDYGSDGIKSI